MYITHIVPVAYSVDASRP